MDDDAVLMAIGKLQGQVEGLGREIKGLTVAVGEGSLAMQQRHESLCSRVLELELNGAKISRENAQDIVVINRRIDKIEKKVNTETAVVTAQKHWIDSIYAKAGIVATIILSVTSFLWEHWPF